MPSLRQAVDAFAEAAGATPETLLGVRLAISEAVSNVVHHAYVGRERGDVEVHATVDGPFLVVVVRDEGVGPREREDSPGSGFGLRLIGASTDGYEIRRRDDGASGARLEMRFRL